MRDFCSTLEAVQSWFILHRFAKQFVLRWARRKPLFALTDLDREDRCSTKTSFLKRMAVYIWSVATPSSSQNNETYTVGAASCNSNTNTHIQLNFSRPAAPLASERRYQKNTLIPQVCHTQKYHRPHTVRSLKRAVHLKAETYIASEGASWLQLPRSYTMVASSNTRSRNKNAPGWPNEPFNPILMNAFFGANYEEPLLLVSFENISLSFSTRYRCCLRLC